MARVLAYTAPATGQLFPLIDTLLELRRRGHEVHLRGQAEEVVRLRALGLVTAPIDPRLEEANSTTTRAATRSTPRSVWCALANARP